MSSLPVLLQLFDGCYLPGRKDSLVPKSYSDTKKLILVTGTQCTNPSWLLQSFVRASLIAERTPSSLDISRNVVFVSFEQDYHFHLECFKKSRLNISEQLSDSFVFIDGVQSIFSESQTTEKTELAESQQAQWITQIKSHLQRLSANGMPPATLVIEGIDNLLYLGIMRSERDVLMFVSRLREDAGTTIVSLNVLSQKSLENSGDLEHIHNRSIEGFYRMAHAVYSLRPLPTGRAHDITGLLRLVRGGQPLDISFDTGEYQYFVGDGNLSSASVFVKGHG
ncbi:hypothetical protein V1511DRAFT_485755 [Dipodascopsis uninucleata]